LFHLTKRESPGNGLPFWSNFGAKLWSSPRFTNRVQSAFY
jgi:hypothetical protein